MKNNISKKYSLKIDMPTLKFHLKVIFDNETCGPQEVARFHKESATRNPKGQMSHLIQ